LLPRVFFRTTSHTGQPAEYNTNPVLFYRLGERNTRPKRY
jgi:hypothetical protein